MNLNEYQDKSTRTLNRNLSEREQLANMMMGIQGESGEVADILKKFLYQGHDLDMDHIREEIGDTMFYIVNLCNILGLELEEIISDNYGKLLKRFPSGFTKDKSINRDKEVEQAYLKKHEENYRRQRERY